MGEKTLHAVLKNYFEPFDDNQEIKIGGFVADIVGESGIIEIQTRGLKKLVKKLDAFLEVCDVTVVYPIAEVKWVSWLDCRTGEIVSRRKSPKKCKITDALYELYNLKYMLDNPRFHFCVCMLEIDEIRYLNGRSKNKKRGSTRCDRIPVSVLDEIYFRNADDYRSFIPKGLAESFTSDDFAKLAQIDSSTAWTALNILRYLGFVEENGKSGKRKLYCEK